MASSSSIDYSTFEGFSTIESMSDTKNENSDYEDLNGTPQDADYLHTDFWYGQIYFDCVLAQDVFSRAMPKSSSMKLDSMLQSRKRWYGYRAALELCRTRGIGKPETGLLGPNEDAFASLMVLIGKTLRKRSSAKKNQLVRILKETCIMPGGGNIPELNGANNNASSSRETSSSLSWDGNGELESHRYTSALKERGDQEGYLPEYRIQTLSQTPPLFQAEVFFHGHSCRGTGRTKQLAKHEASKEACNLLDIKPA